MEAQRLLRPIDIPLGLYVRPSRRDHAKLLQLISERVAPVRGIVFDACLVDWQRELRIEASRQNVESVLDTRAMELATTVGWSRSGVHDLPWAGEGPHTPSHLTAVRGREAVKQIAAFVVQHAFTAVLAPAHLLGHGEDDWREIDRGLTVALRHELDSCGATTVPIYYPLALPAASFRSSDERAAVATFLESMPIDAIWLRIYPFGTLNSGPVALRGYIEGCRDLHSLRRPLVAERTGTIGLALLAFGAVGAIESGITIGENFQASPLLRERSKGKPFLAPPRVYLPALGAFLTRARAKNFFDARGMKSFFACKESCCPRGFEDTIADPRRHFLIARSREVQRLSAVPRSQRHRIYMDEILRPASDQAFRAVKVEPSLETHRQRIDSWRGTLGALERQGPIRSWSLAPQGRRIPPLRLAASE